MDKKVVVESSLRDHIEYLEKYGYQVDTINKPEDINNVESFDYDAVVVSSLSSSSLNSSLGEGSSSRPSAPVVEAKGKTPEEVYNILRGRY